MISLGQYDMCLRPLEIKDSTRDKSSKLNLNEAPKADINTFKEARVYKFYNPEGRKFMKVTCLSSFLNK